MVMMICLAASASWHSNDLLVAICHPESIKNVSKSYSTLKTFAVPRWRVTLGPIGGRVLKESAMHLNFIRRHANWTIPTVGRPRGLLLLWGLTFFAIRSSLMPGHHVPLSCHCDHTFCTWATMTCSYYYSHPCCWHWALLCLIYHHSHIHFSCVYYYDEEEIYCDAWCVSMMCVMRAQPRRITCFVWYKVVREALHEGREPQFSALKPGDFRALPNYPWFFSKMKRRSVVLGLVPNYLKFFGHLP